MIKRVLRVVLIAAWMEFGFILILLPWTAIWETNYFLNRYPALIFFLLNPYLRGAISGLGLIDAILALEAFRGSPSILAKRS